jgi:hypothetical protein
VTIKKSFMARCSGERPAGPIPRFSNHGDTDGFVAKKVLKTPPDSGFLPDCDKKT